MMSSPSSSVGVGRRRRPSVVRRRGGNGRGRSSNNGDARPGKCIGLWDFYDDVSRRCGAGRGGAW